LDERLAETNLAASQFESFTFLPIKQNSRVAERVKVPEPGGGWRMEDDEDKLECANLVGPAGIKFVRSTGQLTAFLHSRAHHREWR
jgi:hypothetical protein